MSEYSLKILNTHCGQIWRRKDKQLATLILWCFKFFYKTKKINWRHRVSKLETITTHSFINSIVSIISTNSGNKLLNLDN